MKGLLFSLLLLTTIVGMYALMEPKEKTCLVWEKQAKAFLDFKSGLVLTAEVAVCKSYGP